MPQQTAKILALLVVVPEEQRYFTMPSYDNSLVEATSAFFPTLHVQQTADVPPYSSDYFHAAANSDTFGTAAELSAFSTEPLACVFATNVGRTAV